MAPRPLCSDRSHGNRRCRERLGLVRVAAALQRKGMGPTPACLTLRYCCSDVYPRISGVQPKERCCAAKSAKGQTSYPYVEALRCVANVRLPDGAPIMPATAAWFQWAILLSARVGPSHTQQKQQQANRSRVSETPLVLWCCSAVQKNVHDQFFFALWREQQHQNASQMCDI